MTHARAFDPVTNPQPVDEGLLDPGEYEEACEEAERRTAEQIASKIRGMTQQERVRLIDGAIAQDQPSLAAALAACVNAESDCPHLIWIREALREAMRAAIESETKPVDPEDVLIEWHEAPDTAYDAFRQRHIDAEAAGDIKHQRSVDDRLDHEQENAA